MLSELTLIQQREIRFAAARAHCVENFSLALSARDASMSPTKGPFALHEIVGILSGYHTTAAQNRTVKPEFRHARGLQPLSYFRTRQI